MSGDSASPPLVGHLHDPIRTPRSVWLGLTLAPIAWTVQGLAGWWISSRACAGDVAAWGSLEAGGVRAILLLLSAVALGVALVGLSLAVRMSRARPTVTPLATPLSDPERVRFMAMAGVRVSAFFTLGIVFAGLAVGTVSVCELIR